MKRQPLHSRGDSVLPVSVGRWGRTSDIEPRGQDQEQAPEHRRAGVGVQAECSAVDAWNAPCRLVTLLISYSRFAFLVSTLTSSTTPEDSLHRARARAPGA
jgi:hypothetical protein